MNDPACSDIRAHLDTVTDPDELRRHANGWAEDCARHCRNEMFYRDLLIETGRILGRACYRQDDGNYVDEPLALRVPEVAKEQAERLEALYVWVNAQCKDGSLPTDAYVAFDRVRDRVRLLLPWPVVGEDKERM